MEKAKAGSAVTPFQKFTLTRINRRSLKKAPYNPRTIDAKAKKKLQKNLEDVGLVAPIVWNKRTGNIVSGHQRISVMDALERRDDYWLDVAAVDMDDKTEREQVIFMNNEFAMGSFDLPKLEGMLDEISFEAAGFDRLSLQNMLPDWAKENLSPSRPQTTDEAEEEEDEATERNPAKAAKNREASEPARSDPGDVEHFVVLVFKDRDEANSFMDLIHVSRDEKYIDGEVLRGLIEK